MLVLCGSSTGRHIVPRTAAGARFPAHLLDGVRSGAAYHPASAALESGKACRVLHQRWMRACVPQVVQDATPWARKAEPGGAKLGVPVRLQVCGTLM